MATTVKDYTGKLKSLVTLIATVFLIGPACHNKESELRISAEPYCYKLIERTKERANETMYLDSLLANGNIDEAKRYYRDILGKLENLDDLESLIDDFFENRFISEKVRTELVNRIDSLEKRIGEYSPY